MKKRIVIAYLLVLVVFLASVDLKMENINQLVLRKFNTGIPGDVACFQNTIPSDANVLFFSETDGSYDISEYSMVVFSIQYWIAPRLLYSYGWGSVDLEQYPWLIGYRLAPRVQQNTPSLDRFEIVASCGDAIVFRQIP